jgi:hypothetical protein
MKKLLLIFFTCTIGLFGQQFHYSVEYKKVLSATASVITVQMPASASRSARIIGVWIESSTAACEVTTEWNTSAAANTEFSVAAFPGAPTPQAHAYRDSDVSAAGARVLSRFTVQSGSGLSLEVANLGFLPGQSFTVRSAACMTTLTINLQWSER